MIVRKNLSFLERYSNRFYILLVVILYKGFHEEIECYKLLRNFAEIFSAYKIYMLYSSFWSHLRMWILRKMEIIQKSFSLFSFFLVELVEWEAVRIIQDQQANHEKFAYSRLIWLSRYSSCSTAIKQIFSLLYQSFFNNRTNIESCYKHR